MHFTKYNLQSGNKVPKLPDHKFSKREENLGSRSKNIIAYLTGF